MTNIVKETFTPSGNKEKKENKEKITQDDILKFRNIAENSYTELYSDNEAGVDKAILSLEKNLFEFKKIIENKGLTVNGNNFKELAKNITAYFNMVGYIFKPGVTPIGNGQVSLSLSLYKKISTRKENLDNFNLFGKIEKIIKINYVKTVIPNSEEYNGFLYDGVTTMGKDGENQVLIFSENLKKIAKLQNIKNLDNYQDSVEINELSQVYFSNFIPNRLLGLKLSEFINVPNENWNLHHVLEAYSDYETLKQGDFFDEEVERIKNSIADNYSFSKALVIASINVYNKNLKEGDKTPLKEIILNTYETNIKNVVKPIIELLKNSKK